MPTERKARLDALSFVWDPFNAQWEDNFQRLEAFLKEHGHCKVPRDYVTVDRCQLGRWVQLLRRQPYGISAERKARLDTLGFDWGPRANRPAAE